ncbi:hypothetical protein RRG08_065333 [Elysia crispata]|uniref:Uncharacterized protein n=1 Tax=Elysia crispata TaxID=231223 RepID=A0AAE1D061_9GAST|nr:hypothetical protein RRG08_065333 [Elysia crispata]
MEDEEAAGQAIKFARQSGFKAVRAPSVSGLWRHTVQELSIDQYTSSEQASKTGCQNHMHNPSDSLPCALPLVSHDTLVRVAPESIDGGKFVHRGGVTSWRYQSGSGPCVINQ